MSDLPLSRRPADRLRRRVLEYLTPKERAVLLLRWSGMTNRQVAAALGLSPACVGMRLYRARRRLAPWPKLQALLFPQRGRPDG